MTANQTKPEAAPGGSAWQVAKNRLAIEAELIREEAASDGYDAPGIPGDTFRDGLLMAANLAAAAPDLLAALEALIGSESVEVRARGYLGQGKQDRADEACAYLLDQARAAILKARGEA